MPRSLSGGDPRGWPVVLTRRPPSYRMVLYHLVFVVIRLLKAIRSFCALGDILASLSSTYVTPWFSQPNALIRTLQIPVIVFVVERQVAQIFCCRNWHQGRRAVVWQLVRPLPRLPAVRGHISPLQSVFRRFNYEALHRLTRLNGSKEMPVGQNTPFGSSAGLPRIRFEGSGEPHRPVCSS